jgi:hypothetical protein
MLPWPRPITEKANREDVDDVDEKIVRIQVVGVGRGMQRGGSC